MKLLKSKVTVIIALLFVLMSQSIFAQRGHHRAGFSEELQNELGLTAEQKTQIESIKAEFKEKIHALKSEDSEDRSTKRTAMKTLMEEQRTAINKVLTEEQQILLKEKKAEHKAQRKERSSKVDFKGLKTELETYRSENITPVLLDQRAKLETQISAEDKTTIAELRVAFEEKKAVSKAKHKERKQERQKRYPEKRKAKKELIENDEDRKALKALVEKYEESIDEVFAEIASQQEKWKAGQKAITQKYKSEKTEGEMKEGNGRYQHRHRGKSGKRGERKHKGKAIKKGSFLLLAPSTATLVNKSESLTQVKVYPNPATNSNTLDYVVKEEGRIKIEIHDAQGRLVKVLLDANKASGDYQINTDLSDLKNRVYYYVVSDKQGVTTKKFVILDK